MPLAAWILTPVESGLLYTALGVFGGASVVGLRVVSGRRRGRPLRPMLAVGVVVLTLLLLVIAFREGHFPVVRRYEVLITAAWGLGLGAWIISGRREVPALVAVAAPMLALLVLLGLLLVQADEGGSAATTAGNVLHIILAVFGFAGFTISAGVGILYLVQIRLLKRDPTAALARRMPALEKLDRINFVAALFGFPCLTLAIAAGWLFLGSMGPAGARWWLDPTVLASLGGLVVYLALFVARGALGWYGRRIAWLSVIGFLIAVGGYVVATYCTSESVFHA